jgi:hypothetical protein
VFNAGGNIAPDPGKIVCSLHPIENTQIFSAVPCSYGGEAYACALVLSGRRAKKPIHDGSQKNELNGYLIFNIIMTFCANTRTAKVLSLKILET